MGQVVFSPTDHSVATSMTRCIPDPSNADVFRFTHAPASTRDPFASADLGVGSLDGGAGELGGR